MTDNRHIARHAAFCKELDRRVGYLVVGSGDRVDVGGALENRVDLAERLVRAPRLQPDLVDYLDRTALDVRLENLVQSVVDAEAVVVANRSVDDEIVAARYSLRERTTEQATHLLVVERYIRRHGRALDQSIVRDNGDSAFESL